MNNIDGVSTPEPGTETLKLVPDGRALRNPRRKPTVFEWIGLICLVLFIVWIFWSAFLWKDAYTFYSASCIAVDIREGVPVFECTGLPRGGRRP